MGEHTALFERAAARYGEPQFSSDGLLLRRERKQRNQRVAAGVLGIAVFAVAAVGFVRLFASGGTPAADPDSPFAGTWVSTSDADGGTQTMDVTAFGDGTVAIVVTDDVAIVCSGTSSTMTGTGRIEDGTTLVIPSPVYTCDDGEEPRTVSGPPLEEQLRDWTLVLDAETDRLSDPSGGLWVREGADVPSPDPTTSGAMWPQSSIAEVFDAQERADAGDPDYAWQVDPVLAAYAGGGDDGDPLRSELFERFIREELGWEDFSGFAVMGYAEAGGHIEGVLFIRCAPGRTNPLSDVYPDMPSEVRGCAPTIDDTRYETVRFNAEQPAGRGPSAIWVVTGWELLQPGDLYSGYDALYPDFDQRQVEQHAPPSDSDVTTLLEAFLGARLDGEGAEEYLHAPEDGSPDEEVPLLYATTDGAPYVRSETERVQGPEWPTGWSEFQVRLFAEDGTVVEQSFVVVRQDGRLGLMYGSQRSRISTTEDGQAVSVSYSLLDGEVTFAAAPPWSETIADRRAITLGGVGRGSAVQLTMFTVMADPGTGIGCELGPPAADVDALVGSIRSHPDFEVTAPVVATVGGRAALRIDVVGLRPLEVGDCVPMVLERLGLAQDDRARLYLLDLPDGMAARVLTIAISAADSEFERVTGAAVPVLESFEFHPR